MGVNKSVGICMLRPVVLRCVFSRNRSQKHERYLRSVIISGCKGIAIGLNTVVVVRKRGKRKKNCLLVIVCIRSMTFEPWVQCDILKWTCSEGLRFEKDNLLFNDRTKKIIRSWYKSNYWKKFPSFSQHSKNLAVVCKMLSLFIWF